MMNYEKESYDAYTREIRDFPVLTAEREIELARRIEAGDKAAEEEMINCNLKLVLSVVKGYSDTFPTMELIQEGNLGLMKAVKKFDYRKGYKFSTYAVWWIRQGIQRGLQSKSNPIKLPNHVYDKVSKFNTAEARFVSAEGHEPDDSELAEFMGVPEEAVGKYREICHQVVSMDTPVGEDGDACLGDFIEDECQDTENNYVNETEVKALRQAMNKLSPREQDILNHRVGFDDTEILTLEQLGKKYGLSKEGIRQVQANAQRKLRIMLKDWAA